MNNKVEKINDCTIWKYVEHKCQSTEIAAESTYRNSCLCIAVIESENKTGCLKYIDDYIKDNQGIYIHSERGLPKLVDLEDVEYCSKAYDQYEKNHCIELKNSQFSSEINLPIFEKLQNLIQKYKEYKNKKNLIFNKSMEKNFVMKILFWLNKILKDKEGLFCDAIKKNINIKAVLSNINKEQEFLFCYYLALLGCDVLVLGDNDNNDYDSFIDNSIKEIVSSFSIDKVPVYSSTIPKQNTVLVIPKHPGRTARNTKVEMSILDHPNRNPICMPVYDDREKSYEELAKLASSIVMIAVADGDGKVGGTGSGIMIGRDGYILTNFHVVSKGSVYLVRIEDDEEVYSTSEIIKYNSTMDLAVIRIDRKLSPLRIYNSPKELVRGQKVVAIGSPLGLFNSVSDGIISGFRKINDVDMIQFTAPTSQGSSGGAVLNLKGEIIGISTAGFDEGQNINLAVGYKDIMLFAKGFTGI